jgi:hypothetical protein
MKLNCNTLFAFVMVLVMLLSACSPAETKITVVDRDSGVFAGLSYYNLYLQTCAVDENGNPRPETCTYEWISVSEETFKRNDIGYDYMP